MLAKLAVGEKVTNRKVINNGILIIHVSKSTVKIILIVISVFKPVFKISLSFIDSILSLLSHVVQKTKTQHKYTINTKLIFKHNLSD